MGRCRPAPGSPARHAICRPCRPRTGAWGCIMPLTPTKASAQNGVGFSNSTRIVWSSTLTTLTSLIAADRRRRGRRVGGILPVEHAIIGGERLAVVPFDALLELPGDRHAVLGEAAVRDGRDFRGEHRHQVAIGAPRGQRLIENARAVLVLGADREMRVQQRRPLPPQHLERPAAAAPWSACRQTSSAATATPE